PENEPSISSAQAKAIRIGSLILDAELLGRGQGWSWFVGDSRARYGFGNSLFRVGLSQQKNKFGWRIELAQPAFYGLPDDALVPGTAIPLGLGGAYFSANGNRENVAGIFVKQAFLSIRGIDNNHSTLRLGRFEFSDGEERAPSAPDLAWLTGQRVAHRLIGADFCFWLSRWSQSPEGRQPGARSAGSGHAQYPDRNLWGELRHRHTHLASREMGFAGLGRTADRAVGEVEPSR